MGRTGEIVAMHHPEDQDERCDQCGGVLDLWGSSNWHFFRDLDARGWPTGPIRKEHYRCPQKETEDAIPQEQAL